VTRVVNRIKELPVSQFDDDLRIRLARAIYSSPHFRGYGSMVNPPIHIIVEHGRVTLEGVVNNNVDRMIARSIASNFLAFDVKNELKTTQEAKEELEKLVRRAAGLRPPPTRAVRRPPCGPFVRSARSPRKGGGAARTVPPKRSSVE
jgi:hypothetical protein